MSQTARVLAAALATLLLLPCLGFGLFGLAASQEPGAGIGWTIGYLCFDTTLLGLIAAGWWAALRRDQKLPWECPACGYDLSGLRCEECEPTWSALKNSPAPAATS